MTVLFFTGSGVSASAGIPTYRDGGSSWQDPDLEKKSHANRYGNHLNELWDKHWGPVGKQMVEAEPTYAHKRIGSHGGRVVTQNVDLLHEKGGSPHVDHLHGSMNVRCLRCTHKPDFPHWTGEGAPVCEGCGSHKTRPDVILFGERINKKQFRELNNFLVYEVDAIVVVGASLVVQPAANLVTDFLGGKKVVSVNPQPSIWDKHFAKVYPNNADDVIDEAIEFAEKG